MKEYRIEEKVEQKFVKAIIRALDQFNLVGFEDEIGNLLVLNQEFNNLEKLVMHYHQNGTMVGLDIDTCALCGEDIRHWVHSKKSLSDRYLLTATAEKK